MNFKQLYSSVFLLAFVWQVQAQKTVQGFIYDADNNEPIIGATIVETDNPSNGTLSGIDGDFIFTINDNATKISISYVGYADQEIAVTDQNEITIKLAPAVSLLDEVVVVGYGNEKRSNISGAVSIVTAEEISEGANLRVEQALQGRTAGVQISANSGSPGSALTVRVRGVGTVNNADPLYIVDGIPVEGLDFLNNNDIESINVLKDAASAAIYGARGANGVVLITTKNGALNTAGTISYNNYFGTQSAARKPNLLNAKEYAIIQNEAAIAAGDPLRPEFANPDALGEGTDWLDALFQSAPISNHQIRFSGGGAASTYSISGSYFNQEGIVGGEKSGFERYTARVNLSNEVKPWLTLSSNLGFTHLERNGIPENSEFTSPVVRAINMDPVTAVRRPDGSFAYSLYSDTDIINPIAALDRSYDLWTSNRLVGSLAAEFRFTNYLKLNSTYSQDATFAKQKRFNPLYDLSNFEGDPETPTGEKNINNNNVSRDNNNWTNWQIENYITFSNTFNAIHDFEAVLGTSAAARRHEYFGGGNSGLPSNSIDNALIDNTIDPIASKNSFEGATASSLLSYFGKVKYTLNDKYIFSSTLRMDGSSRFGINNRYGIFPSFSGAWKITSEDFFNVEAVSFLKLRASWGQNGNDKIGDYGFTSVVESGQNYTFGPDEIITNGSVPLTASNPDVKWETTTQTNIGLDAEFFNGILNFTTDFYVKLTSDMLYKAPIPRIVGALPPEQNIGDVKNTGWEFATIYRNKIGKFKYELGGNIAFVKNEVVFLGFGDPKFSGRVQSANAFVSKTEVGQPIASFFGYQTDGIFQNQGEVEAHAFQDEETAPGDIRFVDINGDGVIDDDDQTYLGNPTPDFVYSINGGAQFKGFDLSIFLVGSEGNEIYNGTVRYDFNYVNRPVSVLNRWTGEGTSNNEPKVSYKDPNQNARVSDRFVEDGGFLRIKNVTLGYNFPQTWLEKVHIRNFKVFVSAQNLLTFTKYSGLDPEIGVVNTEDALELGIDRGFYPQARTYLIGVNVEF